MFAPSTTQAAKNRSGTSLLRAKPLPISAVHYPGDGLHFIESPHRGGCTWLDTPEHPQHLFKGRGRLSLGPVLLFTEMFLRRHTKLDGVGEAFRAAYPGTQPPISLAQEYLLGNYVMHILAVDPGSRRNSVALWRDLTDHGLNGLAQVVAIAAQEKAYKDNEGRPVPPAARNNLKYRIRSLSSPHPKRSSARPLPVASSRDASR